MLDRRARQYKTRVALGNWAKHSRASIRYPAAAGVPITVTGEPEEASGVMRPKRFTLDPMTVDQAMFHMEMLGHSSLFFLNAED